MQIKQRQQTHVESAPSDWPVSVAEVKNWMRAEDDDSQDARIALLIPACVDYGETVTGRSFAQRVLETHFAEGFPCGDIVLPYPPLQSVVFVKYKDLDGVLQTLDASLYQVDTGGAKHPGRIRPVYGEQWPAARSSDFSPLQVQYVAGYETGGSPFVSTAVPEAIRQWLLVKVATCFETREELVVGNLVQKIPHHVCDGLLDKYRVDLF